MTCAVQISSMAVSTLGLNQKCTSRSECIIGPVSATVPFCQLHKTAVSFIKHLRGDMDDVNDDMNDVLGNL